MNQILGTSWGRNLFAAILAAILFALIGVLVGTPPAVTIFAAAIFGALLVLIVQLGLVIAVLWSSRRTPPDVGETMTAEVETSEGQQELKRMSFISLFTVAVVQELYVTLFKRDRPLWAFEFFGVGEGQFPPKDYGAFNRYLEWMLIIGLGAFSGISALLIAFFVYATTTTGSFGFNAASILCVIPSFFLGALLVLLVGLFIASVIRRVWILYSTRADESKIK
jgi:MFS family permease